jgi:hypothetical protein
MHILIGDVQGRRIPLPATVVMIPLADTFRTRLFPESAMTRFPVASTATRLGLFNCAVGAGRNMKQITIRVYAVYNVSGSAGLPNGSS